MTSAINNKNNNQNIENPVDLRGIEFIEFVSPQPEKLHQLFLEFGFSKIMGHQSKKAYLYKQNDITFLLNMEPASFAAKFGTIHGPSICSMGWKVGNVEKAHSIATQRGGREATEAGDYKINNRKLPAIYGIGDSLIYFVEPNQSPLALYESMGFKSLTNPDIVPQKGFQLIDHLTNNVTNGTMQKWADFYKNIFGFYQVRYFDIRGAKTGLQSFALRSPDGSFCIPINEASEEKSQINEYLREYNGPGIQHIAFLTSDILGSLEKMRGTSVQTLDIDNDYYEEVFQRVPNVTEDHKRIQDFNVLVDGDEEGYLLQIFTKNIIGPIFIEIIQRKNHLAFGEGNFQALFKSIERDQMKRGVFGKTN